MKLKLQSKHEILVFNHYLNQVEKLIRKKKDKYQGKKVTGRLFELCVVHQEIKELISRSAVKGIQAEQNVISRSLLKISPMQGYIIAAYMKEYERSGGKEYGEYVAFFIQQQVDIIYKQLLNN